MRQVRQGCSLHEFECNELDQTDHANVPKSSVMVDYYGTERH